MLGDLAFAADGIDDFLAVGIGEGFVFDLDVDFPHGDEGTESQPLGERYERMLIYIRDAAMYAGKKSVEDMIAALPQARDERRAASLQFMPFPQDHDYDPDERHVEDCDEGIHGKARGSARG